ncbi:MAG: NUDIX domain-containing protein [Proteobacteria bacterium]|nr:NUDIX domain-containing protein [Pseudomonadota bacterium]
MRKKQYCHFCSDTLEERFFEGRPRLFCAKCNEPIYENPVPATCLIVTGQEKRVLLVKRNVEPQIGFWCLPGGFIELGETPEASALRELKEETGLTGEIDHLLDVVSNPSKLYHTVLIACYVVRHFSGELIAGDDASETQFFPFQALPEIAFKSHEKLLNKFYLKIQ